MREYKLNGSRITAETERESIRETDTDQESGEEAGNIVQERIQQEEDRLISMYANISDTAGSIVLTDVHHTPTVDREGKPVINDEGKPAYVETEAKLNNAFIKDVRRICDEALNGEYARLLFMDRSARGYGLLAHKLLPIIRLYRAKKAGVDPQSIPLPTIHFINPPEELKYMREEGRTIDQAIGTPVSDKLEQKLGSYFDGQKILLVDESENFGRTARNVSQLLLQMFPTAKVDTIHGNSDQRGGKDAILSSLGHKTLADLAPSHTWGELAYGICQEEQDETLEGNLFVRPLNEEDLTQKDKDALAYFGYKSLHDLQSDARSELNVMAKKLLFQLIENQDN